MKLFSIRLPDLKSKLEPFTSLSKQFLKFVCLNIQFEKLEFSKLQFTMSVSPKSTLTKLQFINDLFLS